MTQEERWLAKYNEVMDFMEKNHRNLSRHRIEEHDMLNWLEEGESASMIVIAGAGRGARPGVLE